MDDLVIVDMPDTLMVTTRALSQEVKRLIKKANDAGWRKLLWTCAAASLSLQFFFIPTQIYHECLVLVWFSIRFSIVDYAVVELEQNRTEQ